MVRQTAGRDELGTFSPKFAELNDDVWSREEILSRRDRSLDKVSALLSPGSIDTSFTYHLTAARKNGMTRTEIAEFLKN